MIAMAVDFSKNVYCRVKKLTNYFQCYAQSIFLRPCYLPMRSKNVGIRKNVTSYQIESWKIFWNTTMKMKIID